MTSLQPRGCKDVIIIPTYGCVSLTLILGLNHVSTWYVVVANVQIPINGADFLIIFGLLINCWQHQLCKESCSYPHPAMSCTRPFPVLSSFSSPASTWTGLAQFWQCTTPPRLCSSTHTSKTRHMYFCTKMHYAVAWMPLTVAHTKLLHAWTKPPNSSCMAVHHCIGCWSNVSLYAAADHETVTIRPTSAWSAWTATEAGTAHLPAPQTIWSGHHNHFQLTIRPEQPSLHGMMWEVPPITLWMQCLLINGLFESPHCSYHCASSR